ncbi:MAG TPA: helical backbone metal receptor [Actinomycetota bacterium]|nr:helical backbone metal receptor [Actinomycetota bacterium]
MRIRVVRCAAPAAAAVLLLAACSKATTTASTTPSAGGNFPQTIQATNGAVTIEAKPTRIVSLSPTLTEDLYAEGAGPQVVAVDQDSNYPAGVPKTSLSGVTPNVEAIAGYRPDLVVLSGDVEGLIASLGKLGIPVLNEPAANTLADAYTEMTQLGAATGHTTAAAALVDATRAKVSSLVAALPSAGITETYYYELDQTFYTATSHTFIGSLFSLAGLKNIADPHDDGTGYPQLNPETIIAANPDFVFLADSKCCAQTAATIAARPGWATLSAVKDHRVITLDDDIASRWGPRVTDLLAAIVQAVKGGGASPTP